MKIAAPFLFLSLTATGQLQPIEQKKLCLSDDVTRLNYIHVSDRLVICLTDYGKNVEALDFNTGALKWSIRNSYNAGFGVFRYGNLFAFSCNANVYDEKLKKSIPREWLFTAEPSTGKKVDSTLLKYSIVTLSPAYAPPLIPAVIQDGDVKMKAVLINAQSGEVLRTLFTEQKEGSAAVVPNIILSDKKNQWVAVGTSNGSKGVYIHDFNTGALLQNFAGKGDVTGLAFSEDGSKLVYLQNATLYVIDTKTWSKQQEIATTVPGGHIALHPDGENVVVTGFGSQAKVTFVHLPSGKTNAVDLALRGGQPYFTENGKHLLIPSEGVQCKVNPSKMPYLTLMTFAAASNSGSNTVLSSGNTATNAKWEAGMRVYSNYSGKFYSATLLAVSGNDCTVVYDDNYVETKKLSDIKPLTPMKAGDFIQCRSGNGTFVEVQVLEVKQHIVQVKFANGATEWVSVRNTMQMER